MAGSVFRSDALDLVVERFPDDEVFPHPEPGDAIAGVFHLALEFVACAGRSLALGEPRRFLEEEASFLRVLRGEYRTCVRGQRKECWGELRFSPGSAGGECPRAPACRVPRQGSTPPQPNACNAFRTAWARTSFAFDGLPPASPGELGRRVVAVCPVLGIAADPDTLAGGIGEWFPSPLRCAGNGRSVHGLAARLCTGLVEECLAEISRRLHLPPEQAYRLLG